jgi:hypothetical protein
MSTFQSINKHLAYGSYVARHKVYVGIECLKQGLFVRALTHDISKLLPSEWFPYVDYFYGTKEEKKAVKPSFAAAWLKHQHRNDHHHQHWVRAKDDGGVQILEMPRDCVLEMLCDWCGAGKAQGFGGWDDTKKWYARNNHTMKLHPDTRAFVEKFLEEK